MSKNAELIAAVLPEVMANRANLANQLKQLDIQKEQGAIQIAKFDALIAALQVSVGDTAVQALIDTQAGANALAIEEAANSSPTDAAPGADGSAAAAPASTSEDAATDTAVAESDAA